MSLIVTLIVTPALTFQGVWVDDNDSPHPGFADVYGPLFQKFSPSLGCGYGYLFGAFLLCQKLCVIVLIGTTVKKEPAGAKDSAWQLFGLSVLQLLQFLFIVVERPFNEWFENIVQAVVTFAQGFFLAPNPKPNPEPGPNLHD